MALTIGETPAQAVRDVEALDAVRTARAAGLRVDVGGPPYREKTWRGYLADNPQIYRGWLTPEDHPAIRAAVTAYRGVVTPPVAEPTGGAQAGALRREPRVDRWIFSTDGVGFPIPVGDRKVAVPEAKRWVVSGDVKHPECFRGAGLAPSLSRSRITPGRSPRGGGDNAGPRAADRSPACASPTA